jgi:hypothetical protein
MKRFYVLSIALLSAFIVTQNSIAQTSVKMNEVYSRGVAGNLDWIEIYNSSATQTDISGFKIYDIGGQGGIKAKKLFPVGTILPAKGFSVIIVDTATFVGDTSGFGLSSSGETVWLENAAGTLIDSIAFPALGTDTSYARIPDGSNVWKKTAPVTRGVSNVTVKMNEIYSRGVAGNLDWIEIYNSSATQMDISGFKIYDIGGQGGTKSKKLFPVGTILPAKGFSVIIVDTATFVGDTSGFGLSSSGETVWLENAAGTVIDTVVFPALGTDTSYARVPDGSNVMVKKSPVTRGTSNGTGVSVKSEGAVARGYVLHQNYPNPFNPVTTIRYQMATSGAVRITVFDLLGKEIATLVDEQKSAGEHVVQFDARQFASGMYFCLLKAGAYSEMKKMVLIK